MVYPSAGENSSPERNENGILAQDASRTPNSEIQTTERDTELGPTHVEAQNVYTDEAITARSSANIADFRVRLISYRAVNDKERYLI
jgi:hypothetical protein